MLANVMARQSSILRPLLLVGMVAYVPTQILAIDRGTDQGSASARLMAARAARRAGDFDKAERLLKQGEELGGRTRELQLERTLLQAQQGDLDDMEKDLQAILTAKNHPDAPLAMEALIPGYLAAFRYTDAARTLEAWLQRRPKDALAVYWFGRVKECAGNLEGAVEQYRRVIKLDPNLDRARLRLGAVLLDQGRPNEAVEQFRQVQKRQADDADALLGLARGYHHLGRLDDASRLVDGLLKKQPRHFGALVERAHIALDVGKVDEGIAGLRKALSLVPHDRQANFLMAQALRQVGRQAESEQFLVRMKRIAADLEHLHAVERRLGANPTNPQLRYELGAVLLRTGQAKAGLAWLTRALKADPRHRATHQALADYYDHVGDKEAAARHRRLTRN
jgi:tetratricopeptide (TPR) repeat protein